MPPKRSPKKIGPKKNAVVRKKTPVRLKVAKTKKRAPLRRVVRGVKRKARVLAPIVHRIAKSDQFTKHDNNPIIEPRDTHSWESKATFNPAVLFLDGNVHILYRAIGDDDTSVLGYALSHDGLSIDERSERPVYVSRPKTDIRKDAVEMSPVMYSSGGGWNGGCEDPRLTRIDDTIYLMYTAFDGWGSLRLAMSSISVDDFAKKRWNWKKPMIISPEGEIHKNWVLFPEKIHGKYAVLHSIAPKIKVDYFDTLDFNGKDKVIKSIYDNKGAKREGAWDNWVRGAGPPPIKTKYGWLLFYHAMDKNDPNRYKLGAMILSPENPEKVLYRSSRPLLEPDEYYENHGFKGGVIYSCGAGVVGDQLFVYYGGADTVVCVATANLDKFLKELRETGKPHLQTVPTKRNNARR